MQRFRRQIKTEVRITKMLEGSKKRIECGFGKKNDFNEFNG